MIEIPPETAASNTFRSLKYCVIGACLLAAVPCLAQDVAATETTAKVEAETIESTHSSAEAESTITERGTFAQLQYVQNVLSNKLAERSALGEQIEQANEQDKTDLRRQANDLTNDIQQLRITLENIAIGGVDTALFVEQQAEEESNWRGDITLIAQPVIDSLKELTEKPRKLKELNDQIGLHETELDTASQALENLQPELARNPQGDLQRSLQRLNRIWTARRDDAKNNIDIARFQIADLQGDKPLAQTIITAILTFLKGRGLTLAMAGLAALIVWFGVRFMLRGYRATINSSDSPDQRTRYRLAAYSVHALTFLLSLIAVFVVFYERGDVLLLGLLILLIVGLALGIRHMLPQYLAEARLLLNIGAMREAERIIYRDLPWRVESINMYTVLRNPELQGVLRIPLAELHEVNSRPAGNDSWFPTSKGDIVLFSDDQLMEVIEQNPDTVELRTRGGQQISAPTPDFYQKEMINLSRGHSFGIRGEFGIGYCHQEISLTQVPRVLREAIRGMLESSDLVDFIKDVRVELMQAGTSSIDYMLYVTMDSKAAKSYLRIQRMMQSACIAACTDQAWDIPYPHVSLVNNNSPQAAV